MTKKYIVVTGASKGIGRATALHLAEHGYHVFAGVRNDDDGAVLMQEGAGAITPLPIDVTVPAQIAAAVVDVQAMVGEQGLTGLVNNAGVAICAPLEFIPIEELREQLEINVVGQIAVTQAFLPLLRQAQGRIVNISSIGGRVAGPFLGPYHASKFALEALTDSLRQELAPWQIAVVGVEPGVIITPIWQTSHHRARQLFQQFPNAGQTFYGERIEYNLAKLDQSLAKGIPAERVAAVIRKALTARRPKTRYLVGMDAWWVINLIAQLPDRWRDWLIARQ